ncbi:MAG: hypothetical protein IPP32_15925 [Bacteroidetes bacterium]|nr:hypothetical protein [Bacteroidota bacterium]
MKPVNCFSLQALRIAKLFLWLFLWTSFVQCKKEKKASIEWIKQESNVQHDLRAIQVKPLGDTLFACGGTAGAEGVILRSVDGGSTWNSIFTTANNSFYHLHFFTDKLGFGLAEFLTIYKTTDGGNTWNRALNLDTVEYRYRVKMHAIKFCGSRLIAVGGNNFGSGIILTSADSGATWKSVSTVEHELRDLEFISSNTGFASGYGTVLKTEDGGISWNATALSDDFFTGIYFTDATSGFLCGYNGNLMKTSDGGENWANSVKGNSLFTGKRLHYNTVEFYDAQIGMVSGESGNSLLTQDGGASWKSSANEAKTSIQALTFKTAEEGFAVGDGGAIFKFRIK